MNIDVVNKSQNELPRYETNLSAGMDVRADLTKPIKSFGCTSFENNKLIMSPGSRALIPTGIFMKLPEGDGSFRIECQIRPRSGLALKKGITVLNTPGTIDADYINEIGVILINHGDEAVTIENGDRIAQMVFSKVEVAKWNEIEELPSTNRKGGFGSTGEK